MVIFLVLGLTALTQLKLETFHDLTPHEMEVRIQYPVASAEDVDETVCRPVEDAVDGISDVKEVRCKAREGLSIAVVEMRVSAEFARFLDDVKTEVEAIDEFAQALWQFGLSMADIAEAISRQSIDLPAGAIETPDQDVLIRFTDQCRSPHELEDLIVVGVAPAMVRFA